jgi:hypothetical protein
MTYLPSSRDTLLNWHRRLGYVNINSIKDMDRNQRVLGLKISDKNPPKSIDCSICQLAKIKRKKIPQSKSRTNEQIDQVADADTVGPLR